jgi:hypothetical protein
MKHCIALLSMLAVCTLFSGCGTLREPTTDVLLTGAGATIGYEASGKKIGGAAIGAGAGYIASKVVNAQTAAALNDAEQRGYDRAMNQSVKQQYWIIQSQQRRENSTTQSDARYVTVTLPETVLPDGTILKPTTATFRTQ